MAVSVAQPFLFSVAGWVVLPAWAGITAGAAFTAASMAVALVAAVMIATARFLRLGEALLLATAALQCAVLIAAAGGVASPLAALTGIPPAVAWGLHRNRKAPALGVLSAGIALAIAFGLRHHFAMAGNVSAWHWLLTAAAAGATAPSLTMRSIPGDKPSRTVLLEAAGEIMALKFRFSGEVTEIGKRAATVLGSHFELTSIEQIFERLHVADRVAWLCAVSELREGNVFRQLELRLKLLNDGGVVEHRLFLAELSLQEDLDGEALLTLRDYRAIEETRAGLANAIERVAEAEIANGRFLASVSHELRTPLNSIIGFADLILHEVAGPIADPRQRDYVRLVRECGDHLLGVVTSVLDIARVEAGTYRAVSETFAVSEAVDLACDMLNLQAEAKSVKVVTAVASGIADITADRNGLQQILVNLLSNAIKFSHTCGTVTVGVRKIGTRIQLTIIDHGIGIAEADLCRIGQPFTQVDPDPIRRAQGTGLGLTLVKNVVAALRGSLSVASTLGEGTTVTVTLPVDGYLQRSSSSEERVVPLSVARSGGMANGTFRKAG